MIFTSITRALMASFAMFATVFKLKKSATDLFARKRFSKTFLIPKFVTDTIN